MTVDRDESRFLGAPADDATASVPVAEPERGGRPNSDRLSTVARNLAAWHQSVVAAISLEMARGTAFVFVPVFLASGSFVYFLAPFEPPLWQAVATSAALLFAGWVARRSAVARPVIGALLCVALGILLAKIETLRAGTSVLGSEISTRLTGRIETIDLLATGRVRLTLRLVATERPRLRYAPERVRVSARSVPLGLKAGDTVNGIAQLAPPMGPVFPGGYDFSFESYFDGIGATGFFLGEPRVVIGEASGSTARFVAAVENLRDALAGRIRRQIDGDEGEIAAALITGVRAGIPEDVNEALRRTGLAHILSISGLHMALVAATIMGTVRLVFACFQNFSMRHPVRKYAATAALFALAAYLFISGYQVAAQRSFIMIAIMLVALLFDHAALTMRNLALAAIVVLVLAPHEVVGPSFQMSFAATAALIGAYAAWVQRRLASPASQSRGVPGRLARPVMLYVVGLAATSLLAGGATAIFGAYHFQRVSPFSLPANLAAMPVVSLVVMPSAVLSVAAMPFGLEAWPLAMMGEGLRVMLAIADWFSQHSPLDAVGFIAPGAVVAFTLALLFATLFTTWLRGIALPFGALGAFFLLWPPRPAIYVSEDARLAAYVTPAGGLAVSRSRPNPFVTQNWARASRAQTTIKPDIESGSDTLDARRVKAGIAPRDLFLCSTTACAAEPFVGEAIVLTADAAIVHDACGKARTLIIEDAALSQNCEDGIVVTRRDLARLGSAVIYRDAAENTVRYRLRHAIAQPYRPWHEHRHFSREARGLPAWQPDRTKSKTSGKTTSLPQATLP